MKSALHVGAVIDSTTPALWVNLTLNAIEANGLMQLHVVVVDGSSAGSAMTSDQRSGRLAEWLLEKVVDTPLFTHDPWQAQALSDSIPVHGLATQPDSLAHCDVILNLTQNELVQSPVTAQVPIWSAKLETLHSRVRHCLTRRAPFIWIHLWSMQEHDVAQAAPEVRIASHALPCQSYSISDLCRLSYSALPGVFLSRLVWLANSPKRKLDPITDQAGSQGVFSEDQQYAEQDANIATDTKAEKLNAAPKLSTALSLLLHKTRERLHHKLFTEHWQLAVSHSSIEHQQTLHDVIRKPVHEYATFAEPPDVMWADPHLCEYEGDTYVFFEKMHAHNQNAHIAYAKLDQYGKPVSFGDALVEDYHLSFPFVFSEGGCHYMIPETASQRNVCLYKATRFPDQWEKHATLLQDINAADTVLVRHAERWWMFTNCQSHLTVDERDELHLYFADSLEGPWQPHALNPVLTGVDRARMAGPILDEAGELYRTSQYGAHRYGYGINISRIDELTPTSYRETAVQRIVPEQGTGWSGCHSFGRLGNLTIIDRVRFSRR